MSVLELEPRLADTKVIVLSFHVTPDSGPVKKENRYERRCRRNDEDGRRHEGTAQGRAVREGHLAQQGKGQELRLVLGVNEA